MKRFALASIGSRGDVEPFVLLANALASRNHAVTLALDDGYLTTLSVNPRVVTSSLGTLDTSAMVGAVEQAVQATTPVERSRTGYERFVGHRRDDVRSRVVELASSHDVLVIADSLAFVENDRFAWPTRTAVVWYTRTPDSDFRRLRDVPALHLVAMPKLVASQAPDLRRFQYTGFWFGPDRGSLPADVEAFLAAGRPPMFLTMGSMAGFSGADLVRAFCAAARSIGERVVIQRGWQQLDAADTDALVVDEVDYGRLFPRCAAVFVHGGTGTVARALRAGVPTAIVPLVADQFAWAATLAEVGIGTIDPRAPDETAIVASMQRALEPQRIAARSALAARFGVDGLTVACELLER